MIDLHCHFLPGIDDGPRDMATAIELAKASAANGITQAVLTPHVYPGRWDNTLTSLQPIYDDFTRGVADAGIPIKFLLGAEVHLHVEILSMVDRDEVPFIGSYDGYKVMLLELPDGMIPPGTDRVVDKLIGREIVPMIAHPERNKDVMRSVKNLAPLIDAGCLLQLTAASVCGRFGKPAHHTALTLLDSGHVSVIATDAHNLNHRPPILAQARQVITERYGRRAGEMLTEINPGLLISDHSTAPQI